MVIDLNRAKAQAEEFGHSVQRELAYLAVHSVLHLLGYDHLDERSSESPNAGPEEAILEALGVTGTRRTRPGRPSRARRPRPGGGGGEALRHAHPLRPAQRG